MTEVRMFVNVFCHLDDMLLHVYFVWPDTKPVYLHGTESREGLMKLRKRQNFFFLI